MGNAASKGLALYAKHFRAMPETEKSAKAAPRRSGHATATAMRGTRALARYAGLTSPGQGTAKTSRQLAAEIAAELDQGSNQAGPDHVRSNQVGPDRPVLTRGSTQPMPPFPGSRTPGQLRASVAKSAKAPKARATMTQAQFFASLAPVLSRRGPSSVDMKTIAKRVRADLGKAIDVGLIPEGTKFSITTDHNSLNVDVSAWVGEVFSKRYTEHLMDPKGTPWDDDPRAASHHEERQEREEHARGHERWSPRLSPALNKALVLIDKIAELHNYDESNSQVDYFNVGYYCNVSASPVEAEARRGIELESSPAFAALMAKASLAAQRLGPAVAKAYCGNKDLRGAGEWCLKNLIKLDDKAQGRPVRYNGRQWVIAEHDDEAKIAALPTISLGGTTYRIASGSLDDGKGILGLIGARGADSHLVQARGSSGKEPSRLWSHNVGARSTWYVREVDGTFRRHT